MLPLSMNNSHHNESTLFRNTGQTLFQKKKKKREKLRLSDLSRGMRKKHQKHYNMQSCFFLRHHILKGIYKILVPSCILISRRCLKNTVLV